MPNGLPAPTALVLSQDLQVVALGRPICVEYQSTLRAGEPASYDAGVLTCGGRDWVLVNPADADDALYSVEEFEQMQAMRSAKARAA